MTKAKDAPIKTLFYLSAGFVLASITWSAIKHSEVTNDPLLSIVLLGMMFFIIGKFFVDRWRPEYREKDFHHSKFWKIPYDTTKRGLWIRVGFRTVIGAVAYAGLAAALVLTTTAQPQFMALLVLRMPHLYWSMRSRYERIETTDETDGKPTCLRYSGGSDLHCRALWLTPTLMSVTGAVLATAGVLLY